MFEALRPGHALISDHIDKPVPARPSPRPEGLAPHVEPQPRSACLSVLTRM